MSNVLQFVERPRVQAKIARIVASRFLDHFSFLVWLDDDCAPSYRCSDVEQARDFAREVAKTVKEVGPPQAFGRPPR